MALKFSTNLRNGRSNQITALIGSGAVLNVYAGTRPSTPNTALSGNTLLGTLALSSTPAPASVAGVLTFNPMVQSGSALASGTATWFSIIDSSSNRVLDGDVSDGSGSGDLQLNSVAIVQGGPILINSYTITEPA